MKNKVHPLNKINVLKNTKSYQNNQNEEPESDEISKQDGDGDEINNGSYMSETSRSNQSRRSNGVSNSSKNIGNSNKSITLSKKLEKYGERSITVDKNKDINRIDENQEDILEDDKISTTSSELSHHENEINEKSGKVKQTYDNANRFTIDRNKMKTNYFDNVVDEMLGVINDYKLNIDINHAAMAEKRLKSNNHKFVDDAIYYAKMLGIWRYNLHELIIYERYKYECIFKIMNTYIYLCSFMFISITCLYMNLYIHTYILYVYRIEVIENRLYELTHGLKAKPALINQYDEEGHTPLSIAIKTNRRDVAFSLMSNGASPDIFGM
jgi:hypothetical protein